MERYDNQQTDSGPFWPKIPGAMIPGLILVAVGALFLLDNLHIVHVSAWFAYWPVLVIAVGLVKLVDSTYTGGRIAGGVMMTVGGLFLADNLGFLRIDQMWPLILIAIGVFMLWNRMHPGNDYGQWWRSHMREQVRDRVREKVRGRVHDRPRAWDRSPFQFESSSLGGNTIHEVNVFSGTRRVITNQDFRGGKVACVFGGITLDLTGAEIGGKSAQLEIAAVYGGAVVRVPPTWDLVVRGAGVFGGYSDQTIHPPLTPETKQLIVKGAAVFGGVTFKN